MGLDFLEADEPRPLPPASPVERAEPSAEMAANYWLQALVASPFLRQAAHDAAPRADMLSPPMSYRFSCSPP